MLPRAARLKRSRDFQAVYNRRRSFGGAHLVLYLRARSAREPVLGMRIGFVISKKVARRAHERNQLKRRLREICRTRLLPALHPESGFDAVFVARASAPSLGFARLAAEVDKLGRQAGLLS